MFLGFYIGLAVVCQVIFYGIVWCVLEDEGYDNVNLYSPSWFKRNTKMNTFGCWFMSIFIQVLTPLTLVWRGIYWVFHYKPN